MVKELLWPSDVLAGAETTAASKPGAEALTENSSGGAHSPVLSAEEMLEVLTWLHAASTFCVRAWHEYDFADRSAFEPLDLSREVKVLSQLVKDVGAFTFFQNQKAESSRVSDRLTTCIGLCHAHAVPFSVFFRSSTSTSEASFLLSHLFTHLPEGMGAAEAVRLIHAVDRLSETESLKEALYVFSSRESGEVQHSERFLGFVKLCGSCSADGLEAIQNVDEDELSVLMRFMVHLKECNREFFQLSKPLSGGGGSSRSTHATVTKGTVMEQRQVMLRFEEVCLARCRHLLYQLDGSATVVMSADENAANALPIVSLQQHRERSEVIPQTFLHYRIGMRHAQGLRRVGIRTQSSNLLELLERLNRTNDTTGSTSAHSSVTELAVDIIHHIATLSASGTKILTLHDVIRVLPILGEVLRRSPSRSAVETRYERLLLHISTTIGVELQNRPSMDVLIAILEGLAKCQWIPSTFPQLEMVVTRYCIEGDVSVRQANKVLLCMLTLRGPLSVSPALLHSIASVAQKYMASGEGGVGLGESASAVIQGDDIMPAPSDHHAYPLLELLHSLRYARYAPLPGLIAQLSERVLSNGTTGESVRIEGWDLPSRCAFGSLLAYLGTSLERQEFNNAILDKAREELRASESALPLLKPSLCMDTLLAYAALEVSFSEQSRTYVLSQCTELHSFVTPRHAVNMLNCLEVLGCQDAVLYHRYAQWLEDHCKTHSRALLDSETRQAVMDLFHLRCLPPSVKTMALKTLEEDLRRIEQERDGLQEQHGLKSSGSSFEESYLLKRDALGELDSIIMEICAVIHRAQKEEIQC